MSRFVSRLSVIVATAGLVFGVAAGSVRATMPVSWRLAMVFERPAWERSRGVVGPVPAWHLIVEWSRDGSQ